MKKLRLALVASLALATSIIGINAPTQASVPQATLITCTDLNTHKQIALKPGESACPTFQAPAVWRSVQTDTGIPKGTNITTLKVCTSKNPSYTYQVIANWCPKYQVSTTYYRSLTPPSAPAIISTIATSYNSAQLLIAGNSASDSPVAYYLVKNLATGITQKVAPTNSKTVSISGLAPSTTYSFSITAVNVDGTSIQSSASQSIVTPGYVSPQNSGPSQSADATLSGMVVTTATLSPSFSSNVTSYSSTVSNATTSVTESATVTESHATLTINGTAVASGTTSAPIALTVGANTITTVVTAQNGSTKTYTVTITRTGANDATISAFSFNGLSPVVTGTVNNTAHTVALYVPSGTNRTALVATFSIGVGATMTIGGVAQTSGVTANNFTSPLTYTVTAQDGVTTQNFVVTVTVVGASPTITSLGVSSGPRTGATSVVISGTNFQSGATVLFGSTAAASVTFTSATSLTAVTPAHAAGLVSVSVTNPDTGNVTANNAYTFNYIVGDAGPGGGTIFYVSAAGFSEPGASCSSNCNYLEWAPSTWSGGSSDPALPVTNDSGHDPDSTGYSGLTLGTGLANTKEFRNYNSTTGYIGDSSQAAFQTLNYGGTDSSAGQWFIPSQDELNLMCRSSAKSSGNFSGLYWTSSTVPTGINWYQDFSDCGQVGNEVYHYKNIRPIRAFTGLPTFALSTSSEYTSVNTAAVTITSTGTGVLPTGYSITPQPPAGMTFNATTGALSGTPTASSPTTTYTVTATNLFGTFTRTLTFTVLPTSGATCANGGTCAVGDTGPGGGTVYYVSVSGFTCGATHTSTCHYLEVAPNTWNGGASDPTVPILAARNDAVAIPGVTPEATANLSASALGLGYQNTIAIASYSNNSVTAAGLVRSYNGGTQNDWYIGDMSELNLLCQWVNGGNADPANQCSSGSLTRGGFTASFYWSSSQWTTTDPNTHVTSYGAHIYYFSTAQIASDQFADSVSCKIRPIRSF